jgi:DNA-binding SARP family transcriptional activator
MQGREGSAHNPAVTTRAVAWSLLGVSAAFAIVGSWLYVIGRPPAPGLDYDVAFFVAFLGFSVIGALVAVRVPSNPVGWLLIAQGVCWELTGVMAGYANDALFVASQPLPAGRFAAWTVNWLFIPAIAPIIVLFLLFPDGHLPSHRWRPVLWLTFLAVVLAFADSAFAPGPLHEVPSVVNPFGLASGTDAAFRVIRRAGDAVFKVAAWAAILSLVFRFRRAGGVERRQLKWLAVAGGTIALAGLISSALDAAGLHATAENVFVCSLLAVPCAVAIAVLRYRLYDVDVVINKTLIFGGLVAFITAVYVAFVVGVGAAVGRGLGSNVTLAVVATALVAVAFEPVRALLHRMSRRLVFGAPTPKEKEAGMAIRCLGAFRVFRDGELVPVTAWQSKKARTLLKILVARRGRATTRDSLMDTLWPDEDPVTVSRRLSVALVTVRRVLDPGKRHPPDHFIVGDKDAVRLDLDHVPVDVEQFLAAAATGLASRNRADERAVMAELTAAADLYAGDFLEEDQYDDWAAPLRDEARTTYVSVLRALAGLAEETGTVDEAARARLRILDVDPWNEEAHLGLVRVMERAGRHGEARRYFESYRSRMGEIGVPVGPFPTARPA